MTLAPPPIDESFEEQRRIWIECLDHQDPRTGHLESNCVMAQLTTMLWDSAAYNTVVGARACAEREADGELKINALTHRLLDRCFFQSQLMGIRRLLEKKPPTDKKLGVYSLAWIVSDLEKHQTMFTRRNLFAAFKRSMDCEAIASAEHDYCEKQRCAGVDSFYIPREFDAASSASLHADIDRLCGVSADSRKDGDVIHARVFEGLTFQLARIEGLCHHVNKFVAHAATPASRDVLDETASRVTYSQIREAQEILCRTCQFIDGFLLRQTTHHGVPLVAGDPLKYIDQPLARRDQVEALRASWADFEREAASWGATDLEWVLHRPSSLQSVHEHQHGTPENSK
jgi:hypothetical protein